jgi:hypothetical protein
MKGDEQELSEELEALVKLRLALILVPTTRALSVYGRDELGRALTKLTFEVRGDIKRILAKYKIEKEREDE